MYTLKKIVLVIIVSVTFFVHLRAQSPGYMGKKCVVGYGLYFNPAFSNIVLDYGDKPFNVLHEFFLEYATGKKFMLGASLRLYKYTYNNIESVNVNGSGYSSSYYNRENAVHPSGSYDIKARNFLLYGKVFKSNYLAPWGRYFVFGLSINKYETHYNPSQMGVFIQENNPGGGVTNRYFSDFGPTTEFYQTADIFFGNGKSRIFANKIVFDYGYNLNIVAMSRMFIKALDFVEAYYPEDYIKNTSTTRVAAINRFNFYFKLGYLF